MGIYNFQQRFAAPILDGSKPHTIRAPRKHPDKAGNTLHLYTGLRQKGKATVLGRPRCKSVQPITITADGRLILAGAELSNTAKNRLAWRDGFRPAGSTEKKPGAAFAEMLAYWRQRLPDDCEFISWDPIEVTF